MRNNSVQFGNNILCVFDIFSKNYLDRRVRIMLFGVVCDSIEQYTPMFWLDLPVPGFHRLLRYFTSVTNLSVFKRFIRATMHNNLWCISRIFTRGLFVVYSRLAQFGSTCAHLPY